ncbi:Gfo/Idh/MocA family protein [Oceanobacillus massiliensis]|uniref:Gfo/Idh/MocA family protein n=1 Tax=Oceanobacillus massiliensis TaxID=1465765 RepID=UPI000287C05F|nr:Gfo/Idh/MocA family oxidoreductase [Oceanobacillus massiliensis]
MINVALLSRWHVHADDYARQIQNNDNLAIQLVWDENAERGKKWAKELEVPFVDDLQDVMANPSIDAVAVSTPTNLHKEVILTAARSGKHIFTEKVLAFSVKECEEIYETVDQYGVELMVSLPRLTEGYYLYAQNVIDNGWIGKLTTIRCRLAHNGAVASPEKSEGWLPERFFDEEQCGGGSLIDLGAHPIYLTNRLAGKVKQLAARMHHTNNLGVDDNAVVLLEYESGAMGIIETSFLSQGSPFQLELYGTEGTLLIEDKQIRINSNLSSRSEWSTPDTSLEDLPLPMEQWVSAILDRTTPTIGRSDVMNLTLINEIAAKSNQEGCWISVNNK